MRNGLFKKKRKIDKSEVFLCLTDEAQRNKDVWGRGHLNPRFLDLDTSWRTVD
jgi:hypothetical protein